MNKKVLLLGITTLALCASTVAVFGTPNSIAKLFATMEPASSQEYVTIIDKDNRLIKGDNNGRYAFRLHGGSEYGYFYASDAYSDPRYLDLTTENSAFKWTRSQNSNKYFQFPLETETASVTIGGVKKELRGFPNAYRVETIYSKHATGYFSIAPNPTTSEDWVTSDPIDNDDGTYTVVSTKDTEYSGSKRATSYDYCLFGSDYGEEQYVIIHSIKIYYTC